MEPVGLYLHIPFCTRKCPYCDFYSVVGDDALMDAYTDALCTEMQAAPQITADSLYLGGGTPILLGAPRLMHLLEAAKRKFSLTGEITLEANPDVTDAETLWALRTAGFNRISFGMQSANERELAALSRTHTPAQVATVVRAAADAGFADISVDLMIGTPHQTVESLCQSIDFLATLPLTHVSAYLLKIEPQTTFNCDAVWESLPDEDTVSDAYLAAVEHLEAHGFLQYEISNFAKAGHESRHNLKYWECKPYLGFGPAASGFYEGVRYTHPRDLGAYIKHDGRTSTTEEAAVNPLEEAILLGFRLTKGLDLFALSAQYAGDWDAARAMATRYEQHGLVRWTRDCIRLTPKGFLLSNRIIVDFLEVITALNMGAL